MIIGVPSRLVPFKVKELEEEVMFKHTLPNPFKGPAASTGGSASVGVVKDF